MTNGALPGSQPAGAWRDLVFISYSHRDRDWLERLKTLLKPYERQNLKIWADPYIEVGGDWRREISTALSRACVGVLLVSPDFLASDFIYDEELPPLLKLWEERSITIVPILISACSYKATPIERIQFAHPPENPLDEIPGEPTNERNKVLVRVVSRIAEAAQKRPSEIPARRLARQESTRAEPMEAVASTAIAAERNQVLVRITDRIVKAAKKRLPKGTGRTTAYREGAGAKPLELITANAAAAILHGVPPQRPNYLRRQQYLEALKQAILGAANQASGINGPSQPPSDTPVGLHGMGGIGKTVLAIDFANDEETRRAFSDGIYWLTLGQTIEPLGLQGELAGYMAGEAKAYATVNDARDQLRQLFDGKRCLLVLDDLWRPQDAELFDVLGPRSRLLVTTRDADLLVALGARDVHLEVLSEEPALELLASWSGQSQENLPASARKVAESCGYLPLALALAGARVQGGARWEGVLSALERGRLEFLDHPYGSVFGSLRYSTDALAEFDRDRYFELAVFPEDLDVPVEAVCTLWRQTRAMERPVSEDLLLRLHRRALLIRSKDGRRISFHDLQHDFLRLNIPSLARGHAALIDAYRAIAPSGWASGPDDGYFFQHLPQHLAAADRPGELRAMLCNYDWLSAKLRANNVTSILADYDLIAQDQDLTLVQQALRLSSPALSRDDSQLPGQLLGRLRGVVGPAIEALLARAEQGPGRPWLRPRFASLTPPGGPLRQILVGHKHRVYAVAALPDGRCALSASDDGTLRLWDLATGETLRTLEGHTHWVTSVAVLSDSGRALSGSGDKTLRLWDLGTRETLLTFTGHTGTVEAVAVFADGHRALSGSVDKTLRLWDLTTGRTLRTLEGHTARVRAVAVVGDGSRALSGSDDNTLRLWDLTTGETLRILKGHTDRVCAVALLADGRRALSGSHDNTVRLWDLTTGETLCILEGHTNWVTSVAVLPDGRHALSGSWDKTLRLWDLKSGTTLTTLTGHAGAIDAVAVAADGRRALSGARDNTVRLWDLAIGATPRNTERHAAKINMVAVVADGSRALSGSDDNTLRLWDLTTGESLHTLEGHTSFVRAVAVLADGRRALSGSWDNTLRLWDLDTGESLRTLTGHTYFVSAVAVLADGRHALSGSWDKTLRLWDLDTGESLRTLEGHTNVVDAVAVLADGRRALSGSWDNTLRLWDLDTGETLRTLEGHTGWVTAVAVLPDGSRALSISGPDNTLRLWDLATGATVHTLEGHTYPMAVLADGRRALSGFADKTLRLWDLATGESLRTLEGHTGQMLAVLADGSRALSGSSGENTLRLWDLTAGECVAHYDADAAIDCAGFARNDLIVACSHDGKIHILEIRER